MRIGMNLGISLNTGQKAAGGGGPDPMLTDLAEWWELDEASGDRTGAHAGIVLTQSGTVGSGLGVGDVGTAAEFDGVNDKLQVADNATLSLGADTPVTIAFWVRFDTGSDCWVITKTDGGSAAGDEYLVTLSSSGGLRGGIGNGVTGDQGDFSGAEVTDETWAFVVWQHDPDADVHRISVNNGSFITRAWSGGTQDAGNPFCVGAYFGGSQWFKGRLARLGIWKRLLTDDEITDLYNGGAGRSYTDYT